MSFYRTRKQIIIGFVYLLLFALVGAGFYYGFIYQAPSCLDNIKNQDEEDVDCGGICPEICIPVINIEVAFTQAISLSDGYYDLVAKIRNPNPNYGAPVLRYRFELKDASSQIIAQKEGVTFILPNSSKYLIENNFFATSTVAAVSLKVEPLNKSNAKQMKNYEPVELVVKDKRFENFNQPNLAAEASGVVENKTTFGFDKVVVSIVLFDENKKAVGAAKSAMGTLIAGEERYFSTSWTEPLPVSFGTISPDMLVETNLFSNANFIRIYGEPVEP